MLLLITVAIIHIIFLGRIHTAVLLISCEHITTLGMVHTGGSGGGSGGYVLTDNTHL